VGLGARRDRLPCTVLDVVTALDVVTDRHPVHGSDPGGAGLPGPLAGLGDLGMLGDQPPSGLGHDGAHGGADLRRQRRGGVPAFDPVCPGRLGAFDDRRMVVARTHRRLAVPDRRDRPLQRIQHAALMPGRGRVRPQGGERLRGQVLQPRTAVEQQRLAEHPTQPVLGVLRPAIPPLVQDVRGLPQRILHRVLPEDQVGQVEPVERAQVVEVGEVAEQVTQGDQERPDRRLGRQRLSGRELLRAGTTQLRPVPARPPPPGPARPRAVLQDDRRRMPPGAAEPRVLAVMQGGPGSIQRLDQAGQHRPLGSGPSRDPVRAVAAQSGRAERGDRGDLAIHQPRPAIPGHRLNPNDLRGDLTVLTGRIRSRSRSHARSGVHRRPVAGSLVSASSSVSISTRQAWICVIEEASFADNSRPDRWMYCSVVSVLR